MASKAPVIPEPWELRDDAFKNQFLDVIEQQCGQNRKTSAKELHEDWVEAYRKMGWKYGRERSITSKTHPDMVPYEQLDVLERDKDDVFIALCEIARKWIYD